MKAKNYYFTYVKKAFITSPIAFKLHIELLNKLINIQLCFKGCNPRWWFWMNLGCNPSDSHYRTEFHCTSNGITSLIKRSSNGRYDDSLG